MMNTVILASAWLNGYIDVLEWITLFIVVVVVVEYRARFCTRCRG